MAEIFPRHVKSYFVQSVIGEGHIGTVYQAVHSTTGQEVALKVLRADSPVEEARRYFENEAVICSGLLHPHIPRLYAYVPGEPPILAFQKIDGKDGESLLAERPEGSFLPPEKVIRWGIQLADALAYLHERTPSIIFRDLKAAHMMVDCDDQAWLVDFNLALALPDQRVSMIAEPIGTEGFNPPEQYRGEVSSLVDVYALGATLHYLLTGINPRHERLFTYAPPRAMNAAIPKTVSRVIMKALAYEAEERFSSMAEMGEALHEALGRG